MLPDAFGLVRYVGRKRESSTIGVLYVGTYIPTCMISMYGIVCVCVGAAGGAGGGFFFCRTLAPTISASLHIKIAVISMYTEPGW